MNRHVRLFELLVECIVRRKRGKLMLSNSHMSMSYGDAPCMYMVFWRSLGGHGSRYMGTFHVLLNAIIILSRRLSSNFVVKNRKVMYTLRDYVR